MTAHGSFNDSPLILQYGVQPGQSHLTVTTIYDDQPAIIKTICSSHKLDSNFYRAYFGVNFLKNQRSVLVKFWLIKFYVR